MPMRIGTPMPPLNGATEWLRGSMQEILQETEGHPVLIHFWSLSCGMCKDNLPRVVEWREQYRDAGLRLIAVHMPRYPADTDVKVVNSEFTVLNSGMNVMLTGSVSGRFLSRIVPRPLSSRVTAATMRRLTIVER